MAIYTIGDLHLSFNADKPMNIFGENWQNYEEKIRKDWMLNVKPEDVVILPGDFSWAMYLEETEKDFKFINDLPGKKILLKGNHDYWWTTITSMRRYIKEKDFENIDFLYNNSYEFENKIIVGTRGWTLSDEQEDIRLTKREIDRFELSIKDGISKYGEHKEIIAFLHYPPVTQKYMNTDYIKLMKKYNIKRCFYGHLHSSSIHDAIEGSINGIELKLVSSDGLNFELKKIT
ncbi:MAG: serine/threonine protein phosphatase [Clostridia bacterium]|jgi:predicted phosphohydrolase|nr:serine/threonine protein phosphatase [Clostridia bacterium]